MALQPAHTCGYVKALIRVLGLGAVLAPLWGAAAPASATTYYVDVAGLGGTPSDSNPGTITQPFRTIPKAQAVIRATGAKGATVYLRGGTYFLAAPLRFDATDSGAAGAPNVWSAYPGEQVVVSSGRKITSAWTVSSPNIYMTNVGATRFNSLFVDGQRAIRARSPNTGYFNVASVNGGTTSFNFNGTDIKPTWYDLRNVEVVYLHAWTTPRERIASVSGSTVTFQAAVSRPFTATSRYYVENVREGLDQPGEWYLDRNTGNLYYYPIGGKNPGTSEIIAPAFGAAPSNNTGQILDMNGASYVTWQGITFSHSDWYLPATGYAGWQSAIYLEACEGASGSPAWWGVGPGINVSAGSNLTFQDCTITHVGGTAITAMTTRLTMANNTITDIGASGIKLGGTGAGDPRAWMEGGGHTVTGNTIHDIGAVLPEGTGIVVLVSGSNTITHNRIYRVPDRAISVGWDFTTAATACKNNLIAFNDVYQVQQALSDSAAIYLLGYQPGTVVQNNKIRDLPPLAYGTFTGVGGIGIYLDQGSSAITVQNNWVYRVRSSFFLHMCYNNTLQNNVFVDPSSTFFTYNQGSGNRLARNIVYKAGAAKLFGGSLNISSSDYNLFYDPTKWYASSNLTAWKSATGFDVHSQAANPQFVGYATDNFAVSSSSPALSLGFQQIDMSTVGPRINTYTITASAGTGGSITPNGSVSVAQGASQTFNIQAGAGYSISGVQVDGVSVGAVSQYTFTNVTANHTISASFVAAPVTYALTVSATNGSVTKTPNQASYTSGQSVSLQATPNSGYTFADWSGDLTGTANPATLVMNSNKSVTANFTAVAGTTTYSLTVNAVNGSVTKTPNQTSYSPGTVVTLQAAPNAGYSFSSWSGDVTGTTNPTTITMNGNKSVTASFTANTYTLTISAVNGSVTKTPNQTSYAYGTTVTLQAVPNAGYTFSGWSGAVSGTANPTTVTMTANASVTANFTANTYSLTVSAVNGSVMKTPNQTSYSYGAVVSLQAVPNTGYTFSGWSGAVSGTANPTTITMNANKSVTAGFTANTYTLTVSAANGSVTKTPNQASYASGAVVTLQAVPNTGYTFSGWSGDVSGTANPTTITMNANKSVTASFKSAADQTPPVVDNCSPAPDSIQAPPNTLVRLRLRDEGLGVDAASVSLHVNGHLVYAGDVNSSAGPLGVCSRSGSEADYTYTYEQKATYGHNRKVSITVAASDLAGNAMAEQAYSFATEMYVFGVNRSASVDQTKLDQGKPAMVGDGQGNLWIVWHAGNVGSRQIYAARYVPDTDRYNNSVQISQSTGDHCNPVLAIDSAGTLYVVWQENASGVWDIYGSTSVDGSTWSAPKRVTDAPTNPPKNRINPALAASRQSPGLVAVAWQDDRAGNQEIYVSRSTNQFQTITSSRVTSQTGAQTNPVVAIDSQDVVVVLWTDARNGATDIYGAASDNGPWTNVPVVNAAGNQSWPRVAAGSTGHVLHLVWVDEAAGNTDIFYAKADGLSAGPFPGVSVVDDTSGAAQRAPALTAAAGADGNDQVFVCWEDERNLAYGGTTDLYFAEVNPGALRTNVLVDNDGTSGNQREAALGVDRSGYPCVVWVDDKGRTLQLYYSGATYADPVPLAEATVSAAAGGTVGTPPTQIKTLDDVSVVIPAQACPFDATIRIARIHNPQGYATESLPQYDFGPSGLVFAQPVTVTIPYSGSVNKKIKALWFDSVTGAFSTEGVTEIQDFVVGPGLRALQFQTTHFTPFYLVPAEAAVDATGGGGCSLARSEEADPVGYGVPFLGVAAIMLTLRRRDRRRASVSFANHPESAK